MFNQKIKLKLANYLLFIQKKVQKFPFLPQKIIFAIDVFFVAVSFFLSCYICNTLLNDQTAYYFFYIKLALCIAIAGFFFFLFNTDSEFYRFSSFQNVVKIFISLLLTHVCILLFFSTFYDIFQFSDYSKVGLIISFLLSACIILLSRATVRLVYDFSVRSVFKKKGTPLLIYGIEAIHIMIAQMIRLNERFPYEVVGFISRKPVPVSHRILGNRIYSAEDVFNNVITNKGIKTVLVRAEDLYSEKKRDLFRRFIEHKIDVLSMPTIKEVNDVQKIQKIKVEDLLGRTPIKTDIESISKKMKGKTVLVTGAAGSIGSEIVRQLCRFDLKLLLLVDMAESPIHQLYLDLKETKIVPFIPFIADIRNKEKMNHIFNTYKPQCIFHAAAYKHVPLMEQYPCEAVFTNVIGTKIMADLAVAHGAECFVMISTDKAVNPSNVMGASKRIAEIYVQSLSTSITKENTTVTSQLRFITTRFGNVLGSSGSVIPRFAKQIAEGGPVTVTHPDIIRYFMTIPEACSLVLEAANLGKGGEVFVFDMGESVKIKDLAEEMIRLSGLEPYKDINIVYTGLRPGEKLHEELLHEKETTEMTQNQRIMIGNVRKYDYNQVSEWLEKLQNATETFDEMKIVKIMKEIVPEFISNNSEYTMLDII